jgi:hypothetical protein
MADNASKTINGTKKESAADQKLVCLDITLRLG